MCVAPLAPPIVATFVWADSGAFNNPTVANTRVMAHRRNELPLRNLFHKMKMFFFIKTKVGIVYCLSGAEWPKGLLQSRVLVVSQVESGLKSTGDLKPAELGVAFRKSVGLGRKSESWTMVGVMKIMRLSLLRLLVSLRKADPRKGMSPKTGTLVDCDTGLSLTNPPMTRVFPSGMRT